MPMAIGRSKPAPDFLTSASSRVAPIQLINFKYLPGGIDHLPACFQQGKYICFQDRCRRFPQSAKNLNQIWKGHIK
jgi:hypothetical protein